jgi:hypothetical protein
MTTRRTTNNAVQTDSPDSSEKEPIYTRFSMKFFFCLLPFLTGVFALTVRQAEEASAACICEAQFCPQVWPDSCYCANDAKKACYEKCGGNIPIYDICPPIGVTARAPQQAASTPPPPPPPPATCECEGWICIQSWPESCYCENDAKKACFDKCGGEEPVYQTCPDLEAPDKVAKPKPRDECVCTEINCLQIWPEGCYCANYAKELCYQECGGEKPVLDICPPHLTPSFIKRVAAPTALAVRQDTPTNQVCGGGRPESYPPCPAGQACIADPLKPGSCGPACDQPGICIENTMCGGIAGFLCEKQGQICVDDPRDDCDPNEGGSDCAGVCVWPQ